MSGPTASALRAAPAAPSIARATGWVAPLVAVAVTVLVAVSRLLVNPEFYFADDTQTGTVGMWWELGNRLADGAIPMLDPQAWTAGNYFAEGQWGLLNPVVWMIALWARTLDDPVLMATTVKVIALGLLALGVYLLAREFGASAWWAAAAGVLAPLGGFTVYLDAASWTTGLLATTAFAFTWWGLRRLVDHARNPLAYLISAWMLVTLGYVFGVIVLVIVLVEALIRAIVRRNRMHTVRALGAAAYGAVLTIAVYLPGVLTAPVTVRGTTTIRNDGFLAADLADMAAASTATASGAITAWNTTAVAAPIVFIAWVLPALALLRPARRDVITLVPAFVLAAIMFIVVTGPSHVGPLRWPVRFMPYLVIAAVVIFAVIATSAAGRPPTRRRLLVAVALSLGATWFSVMLTIGNWRWIGVAGAIQLLGMLVLYIVLTRTWAETRRSIVAAGATVVTAVVLVVPQLAVFGGTPLPQLGVTPSIAALAETLPDTPDDAIVVGDIYAGWRNPATYAERLVGNQWYFADTRVSSLYTVLPFEAYTDDLCADLRGATCPEALDTLLAMDETTGRQVAELLGVNAIVVMKESFPDGLPALGAGWAVLADREFTWVLKRDRPVATAGGVVWTSPGTEITMRSASDTRVELEVDAVGADGRVVLSRLAWPGYRVDGADITAPTRGYLLTLDVASAQPGDVVTVEFRPPGWAIEIASLVIALIALVGWPVVVAVSRRRLAGSAVHTP